MPHLIILLSFLTIGLKSCRVEPNFNYEEKGIASYYHDALEGNLTANGEIFSQDSLTAAHRTLPFGTRVLVTRNSNHKQVWVRINDRGPFNYRRIIDLSKRAADSLGMVRKGISSVTIMAIVPEDFLEEIEDR